MVKIYVAGKDVWRARSVMDALRKQGHTITYDWVEEFPTGPSRKKAIAEREGVRSSDMLVYLWEYEQESARYEVGMAMGLGKPVVVSGKFNSFFFQLPEVYCCDSDEGITGKVAELGVKNTHM